MKFLQNIIIALVVLVTTAQAERRLIGYKQAEGKWIDQPEYQAGSYTEAKAHAEANGWHNAKYKPCMRPPENATPEQKKMCQSKMDWMDYKSIVSFMDGRPQANTPEELKKAQATVERWKGKGIKTAEELLRYCGGVWVKGQLWQEGESIPQYEEIPEAPAPAPAQIVVEANLYRVEGRTVVVDRPVPVPVRCCKDGQYRSGCRNRPRGESYITGYPIGGRGRSPYAPVGGKYVNGSYYRDGGHEVQFNRATAQATAGNDTNVQNQTTNTAISSVVIKGNPPPGLTIRRR